MSAINVASVLPVVLLLNGWTFGSDDPFYSVRKMVNVFFELICGRYFALILYPTNIPPRWG